MHHRNDSNCYGFGHNTNVGIPVVFERFVIVVVVVDVAVVVGVIVVVVVFLFVVVVVVVKIAVVALVVFVSDGVGALVARTFVQLGIISITPGVIITLVDTDDGIVDGKLHDRNDFCHAYGQRLGLCTENIVFVIVLETVLISMVSSTLSISEQTSTTIVLMIGIVVISGIVFIILIVIIIIITTIVVDWSDCGRGALSQKR